MKSEKEIWGLRAELAGLAIVAVATIWQVAFTSWFEEQSREWESLIQEEVNLSVLSSQIDIANILSTEEKHLKQSAWQNIHDRNGQAISKAIDERDKRHALFTKGQGHFFAVIRSLLLIIGAFLLALGKWLTLSGVHSNIPADRDASP
jgi:hypothetical protein